MPGSACLIPPSTASTTRSLSRSPRVGEQMGEIQLLDERSRRVYLRDSEGNVIGLYDEVAAD